MTEEEQLSIEIAAEVRDKAATAKQNTLIIEQQFRDALSYLNEATTKLEPAYVEWFKKSAVYLEEMRQWRMAMEREQHVGMRSMQDMVAFLSNVELEKKVAATRELIELMERLKALKDSGFLDDMTEILLKVNP